MIQPIVEGQGDVAAVPLLLRRLIGEAQAWNVKIGRPHRKNRTQLVRKESLETAVRVAALQTGCSGILIVFDADDDCPKDLAPTIEEWARQAAPGMSIQVVMPNREYEAWFLASIETLRGQGAILVDAATHPQPESPRDAKGELERRMSTGSSYSPTVDQAAFSSQIDLSTVYSRSRSFRKLVGAFGSLARAAGATIEVWPPIAWT